MEIMTMPGADGCFQSVDDGGDATFLVHKGKELEEKYAKDGSLPVAMNRSPMTKRSTREWLPSAFVYILVVRWMETW